MKTKKSKVLVGMSGGVDSSVTACLLKDQGYDVIGIHMHFWTDPTVFSNEDSQKFPQNKCCTLEGLSRARSICHNLGIPFYVVNFEEAFKKQVVDFFVDGYGQGITPNPCIECNRNIKFGLFLKKMQELGADYVATGHYAHKITNPDGQYELWMAKDKQKDQTYFLHVLNQEKLKHILFPLGEFTKPQVRELAKKYGIAEVNKQKESQNLCFFPERQHGDFLKRYLQKQHFTSGPIITRNGQKIGTHKGLPLYTIGQRKGLGIGGVKGFEDQNGWYVVAIDKPRNALIVGTHEDLYQKTFQAANLTFIDGIPPKDLSGLQARIRYRANLSPVQIKISELKASDGQIFYSVKGEFIHPQAAITPGQSVVFYRGEKVIGGGIIVAESE